MTTSGNGVMIDANVGWLWIGFFNYRGVPTYPRIEINKDMFMLRN